MSMRTIEFPEDCLFAKEGSLPALENEKAPLLGIVLIHCKLTHLGETNRDEEEHKERRKKERRISESVFGPASKFAIFERSSCLALGRDISVDNERQKMR